MFNTPIFKFGRGNKANLFLQADNIKEDLLAPSIRKQEEMEASALEADIEIKELEGKFGLIWSFSTYGILSNFRGLIVFDMKKIIISCLFKPLHLFQRTNQHEVNPI